MDEGRLAGRVALVTGASRGIGAAVARAFAAEGASVALGYEPRPDMAVLAEDLATELRTAGTKAVALSADLADPDAVEELVDGARAHLGPLDVVVANAALSAQSSWRDISVADWDRVFAVNLRGSWLLARAAYPDLVAGGRGSIITVSSVMARTGQAGALHYTASKAGIIGLTRALARESGPDGVRVNAVMPGAIRTEHEEALEPDPDAVFEQITAVQALKRRGSADDLAGAFVYLASDESAFVTGQVLTVDGGWVFG
ncbi:SDR family NAD(P)-dependent oxidoreductase [Jiangella alkaliphila]|uniref:3-oxoacyl-[acyl-carrier protein] reductase n=1 Tax=Jiangella alkaliphila TaxID=419479 RepID=A0A1H2LUY4_9ACTN|nr:SDR family oxidoreductase [Jiangella alkaliphila]SDU84749.1 3-oxoacyl-[acyl-carrier protein] reductase [Jiangella alkaliphila]